MAVLAGMSYSDMLAAISRATDERLEIATMENGKQGEEFKQVVPLRPS